MEDGILKQLRKSYRCAEQQITTLEETMKECQTLVESLGNHAEQLQCCQCVAKEHEGILLLTTFDDLSVRLRQKLIQSMEGILAKLHSHMSNLDAARSKVYNQYCYSISTYQSSSSQYDAMQRTAIRPSVADLLQWLADLDRHFAFICSSRQWMLDTLSYDRLDDIRSLTKKWKLTHEEKDKFQDILARISYFTADNPYLVTDGIVPDRSLKIWEKIYGALCCHDLVYFMADNPYSVTDDIVPDR